MATSYRSTVYTDVSPNFVIVEPPSLMDWEGDKFDVYHEAAKLARRDWRDEFGASAIVVDTATSLGYDLVNYVARAGLGRVKDAVSLAVNDDSCKFTNPQMQDYGVAQGLLESVLRVWLTQPLHVFVLGHRGEATKKEKTTNSQGRTEVTEVFQHYGMRGPGQKLTHTLGGIFSQYTYLMNVAGPAQPPAIRWHMGDSADYRGKVRSLHPGAKPYIDLKWNSANPEANLAMLRAAWSNVAMWNGIRWDAAKLSGPLARPFRMGAYGESGSGKTTLFTSFPQELFATGPVVYVGYDPGATYMETTFPQVLGAPVPPPVPSQG